MSTSSCVYGDYNGSYLDCLHATRDRNMTSNYVPDGQCVTATGCYTFFPLQGELDAHLDERRHGSLSTA